MVFVAEYAGHGQLYFLVRCAYDRHGARLAFAFELEHIGGKRKFTYKACCRASATRASVAYISLFGFQNHNTPLL